MSVQLVTCFCLIILYFLFRSLWKKIYQQLQSTAFLLHRHDESFVQKYNISVKIQSTQQFRACHKHTKWVPDFYDRYGNILVGGSTFCLVTWWFFLTQSGVNLNLSPVGRVTPQKREGLNFIDHHRCCERELCEIWDQSDGVEQ